MICLRTIFLIKFTNDEIDEVKSIQKNYIEIQREFGQLYLTKLNFKKQEEELTKRLENAESAEQSFLDKVNQKYGRGSLNPETGVFTPEESK